MKKKIEEVQNYFLNKITACQFDKHKITDRGDGWFSFDVEIDECIFHFSINPKRENATHAWGALDLEIPTDRLKNLINLIKSVQVELKNEKIENLQSELAELTNNFQL